MSNSTVMMECSVLHESPLVKSQFGCHKWGITRCAHDIDNKITVEVLSDQWEHVCSQAREFIVIGASLTDNGVLTLVRGGGVTPFHGPLVQVCDPQTILAVEFFAGGYSGWTHACKTLCRIGIPITVKFAIDFDLECAQSYCRTHSVDKLLQGPFPTLGSEDFHETIFVCDDLRGHSWIHIVGHERFHLAMISPPCPPWSKAAGEQGLSSVDGLLTLEAWGKLSMLQVPIVCMEMVSSMLGHEHWQVVKMFIQWCGYRIMWAKDMQLQDILPQSRSRLLLIAIREGTALHPHRCTEWTSHHKHTLSSYQAIFNLSEMWMNHALPTPDVLDMYLDPAYLPRFCGRFGTVSKKCRRDIEGFRIRLPDDTASCILANYSFSHLLPKHVIERKGLFGSLLLSAQGLRFFALPELIALFGTTNAVILPKDFRKAIRIVGNCIAVPHATLAVANAIAFVLGNLTQVDVQELVHRVHSFRLNHDNMVADEGNTGLHFFRRFEIGISPTQPLHSFHQIRIQSPLEEFVVVSESGVNICELLSILNGPSFPAELFVVFEHQPHCKVHLPKEMKMDTFDLHLQANVPSVLMINEEHINGGDSDTQCVIVLFRNQIVAIVRTKDMIVQQLREIIHATQSHHNSFVVLSILGQELFSETPCPTCVFAVQHAPQWQDLTVLRLINIEPSKQMIRFTGSDQALQETLDVFQRTGTTCMLHALGWHFVTTFDDEGKVAMNCLYLVRRAATYNAMTPDLTMFIISRFFILGINQNELYPLDDERTVMVHLKLWGTWIWKGEIPLSMTLMPIENLWIQFALMFRCQLCIRFIVNGHNINPEASLSTYVKGEVDLKIFTTMSLHGGAGRLEGQIDISSAEHHSTSEHTDASDSRAQLARMEEFSFDQAITTIVSHWINLPGQVEEYDLDDIVHLRYYEEDGMICYDGSMRATMAFLQLMQDIRIVRVLEELGWIVSVQFVQCFAPVTTRIVIFPRPSIRVVSVKIIQSLLHVGFFFAALPAPIPSGSDSVLIRIKVWGIVVFHEHLPQRCPVHVIIEAWNTACRMVNVPLPIRIVCRGRKMNPDRTLGEYMHQREDGVHYANLHLVVALQGGGNQKDFAITQKNALATFLLAGGGDLNEITNYIDAISKAAGPQAIASVLSLKSKPAKWDGLRKLSQSLKIVMPDFAKKQADRKAAIENRFRKDMASTWEDLNLSDIVIKESFFLNEDDSACPQISMMAPSTSGVCLLKANEAEEWLNKTGSLSQDELAIIVIGPCPCSDAAKCHRVQFPAYDSSSQPIVMNGCLHNTGRKLVKMGPSNDAKIKIDETVVVSWTVYHDEVGDDNWNVILQSPVKKTIEFALGTTTDISFVGPPWGRSFQRDCKRCDPSEASSLQFHSRVNQCHLQKLLRISGINGIYTTPKTENKQISNAYQIVWVQMSSVDLIVTASTFDNHCGIVRNSKYEGRMTKGIRFLKDDFQAAFQQLKPGVDVPSLVTPNFTYKITPVPLGATFDHIQKWLDLQKWKAKPLRSLSSQVWLIAADSKIEEQFAHWNGETLLVKSLLPRQERQPVIVAGTMPRPKTNDGTVGKIPLKEDPWAQYRALNSIPSTGTATSSVIPQPVQRKIEGPIESKFQQQQVEIQTLKDSAKEIQTIKQDIADMQTALQTQGRNHEALRQDVTAECQKIRNENKEQIKNLSNSFQESLQHSLAQQDRQLMRQFDDLKELLSRPGAAKKAKAAPTAAPGEVVETSPSS